MAILIDTQSIVWLSLDPGRLSAPAHAALASASERIYVSAVVAYEYADLNRRGRFGPDIPLSPVLARFDLAVIDYPAGAHLIAETLPKIHRDPVDRMLIAHALHTDLPIVTADVTIRSYPVRTIW